jgi:hypothetical protein
MRQGLTQEEAVRLARESLGESTPQEMAAYIREEFGLEIKPGIVTVLLGSLREWDALDRSGQAARARIERWKLENPEEARKMAALVRRREAAKRRKAGLAPAEADARPVAAPAPEPDQRAKAEADLPGL